MIDRKKIMWGITDSEDKLFLSKMCDIAQRSEDSHKVMFSRFLNPKQRMLIEKRMSADFSVCFFGGASDSERTVAAFGGEPDKSDWPICAVKISPRGKGVLSHRDYLGALLSLGIKREHIGDILINEGIAAVFVTKEISDFILMNLNRVASSTVKLSLADEINGFETQKRFKEASVTVSSMRFDCVLSAVTGKSRSQAVSLIEEGLCCINYDEVKNVRLQVNSGDILSVRGFGKFVIETDNSLTRKGRIHIMVKKYI